MFRTLIDWSELWALFIPIWFIIKAKQTPVYLKPIKIFVWVSLVLNLAQLIIWYRLKLNLPEFPTLLQSNTFIYNLLSATRLLTFSLFFILLQQPFMPRIKKIIPFGFILFMILNFTFFEHFFSNALSSRILATEAALLLFYCIQYFIFQLIETQTTTLTRKKGFWIVIGLSIYVAVNFFIFLFYEYLTDSAKTFAVDMWDVHNVVFLILCISIAIQFNQKNDE